MSSPKYWRMAFRVGNRGPSLFDECRWRGIAAIGYAALESTNLSQYPHWEPANLWNRLAPTQKSSLGHVAYDMRKNDLIFVKEGAYIVCKGRVKGTYRFNPNSSLLDECWPHEVPVEWDDNFDPVYIQLGGEQVTVKELTQQDVQRILQATPNDEPDDSALMESGYEGQLSRRIILHRRREDRLRRSKIAQFRRTHGGQLFCEIAGCGFDFEQVYGSWGDGYAQVHHTKQLASFRAAEFVPLTDLLIVCANCHAMIHRAGGCLTRTELERHLRLAKRSS